MLTNTLKALVKNPIKEKLSLTGFFTSTLRALLSISLFLNPPVILLHHYVNVV